MDFITKYLRTKHGVIFRLSNQVFQVSFVQQFSANNLKINLFDHTKLILSQLGQQVTFINSSREISTFTLEEALSFKEKDVIDRLKFARDTLNSMLNKNKT